MCMCLRYRHQFGNVISLNCLQIQHLKYSLILDCIIALVKFYNESNLLFLFRYNELIGSRVFHECSVCCKVCTCL